MRSSRSDLTRRGAPPQWPARAGNARRGEGDSARTAPGAARRGEGISARMAACGVCQKCRNEGRRREAEAQRFGRGALQRRYGSGLLDTLSARGLQDCMRRAAGALQHGCGAFAKRCVHHFTPAL